MEVAKAYIGFAIICYYFEMCLFYMEFLCPSRRETITAISPILFVTPDNEKGEEGIPTFQSNGLLI